MKKKTLSDEEQLDDLLVKLQKKFLDGDISSHPNQKKTKEELDDEKFQARLALMLSNLSASSAKIKKSKTKAAPQISEERTEEEPTIVKATFEEPVIEKSAIKEQVEEAPLSSTTSTERKKKRKAPRTKQLIIKEAITSKPIVEEPIVEDPIVEEPIVEESIVEESIVEESIVEEPIIEEPIVEEPIVIKPKVRIEPSTPSRDAVRMISSAQRSTNEPIRIAPQRLSDTSLPKQAPNPETIVIRPPTYRGLKREPIVIRPPKIEKERIVPEKQHQAPSAQPIKIGKEETYDAKQS